MALITLRVLDGADRGRVLEDLATPVSIGREDGNSVQLNDDRVSRYHLKLQEEEGRVVLTDLDSTNGTRINGESTRISLLRPGDIVTLGRTTLLYGSREEIAARLASLRLGPTAGLPQRDSEEISKYADDLASLDDELNQGVEPEAAALMQVLLPPDLPHGLSAAQWAELADLLQFLQLRLRKAIQSVRSRGQGERVTLDQRQWQNLLDLQDRLGRYLSQVGEPD